MNEKIKNRIEYTVDIGLSGGASILGGLLTDTIVGQVAPGVMTSYLSYKQKRSEKNILLALDELNKRVSNIENHLKRLNENEIEFIKHRVFPEIFDFIINEQQEEKIEFIVNGLENIIIYKLNDEDLILTYLDVLHEIRMFDIRELININNNKIESMEDTKESTDINETEAVYKHIYLKLQKYNLVTFPQLVDELGGDEFTISRNRLKVSVFGRNFINFINCYKNSVN